jgi:hypothetical protein
VAISKVNIGAVNPGILTASGTRPFVIVFAAGTAAQRKYLTPSRKAINFVVESVDTGLKV